MHIFSRDFIDSFWELVGNLCKRLIPSFFLGKLDVFSYIRGFIRIFNSLCKNPIGITIPQSRLFA